MAISHYAYPNGASVVYVVSGTDFPSALLQSQVSVATIDGPLLVTPGNSLALSVPAEIQRLHPRLVVVLGSDMSQQTVTAIRAVGHTPAPVQVVNVYADCSTALVRSTGIRLYCAPSWGY